MKQTRAESLARLALWARTRRRYGPTQSLVVGTIRHPQSGEDAVSHGANAVRAIRESVTSWTPNIIDGWHAKAVSEAREAVHCALAAVGLKTL